MLKANVSAPGAVPDGDVAHGESADKAVDALVAFRSRQNGGGERPEEPSWAESVRRYHASRDAANRAAWADYHQQQAARLRRTLEDLAARHEARARKLAELEGR